MYTILIILTYRSTTLITFLIFTYFTNSTKYSSIWIFIITWITFIYTMTINTYFRIITNRITCRNRCNIFLRLIMTLIIRLIIMINKFPTIFIPCFTLITIRIFYTYIFTSICITISKSWIPLTIFIL